MYPKLNDITVLPLLLLLITAVGFPFSLAFAGQADVCDSKKFSRFKNVNDNSYAMFKACVEQKRFVLAEKFCMSLQDPACLQMSYRHALTLIEQKSENDGAQWLFYAASHDYAKAQQQLGIMFSVGTGVMQSYTKAQTFFTMAKENGLHSDSALVSMVAAKLDSQMKQRAELYKKVLKDRGKYSMNEVGNFTDVAVFTEKEKTELKKKVVLCNVLSMGVKNIAQQRDIGKLASQSVSSGHQWVIEKLKNPPKRVSDYVHGMLKKVSVLVYLGKNLTPETFRLYYYTQCVNSAIKEERPVIALNNIHDVLEGLEKCQDKPGVADSTAFSVCLKKHVLPHVSKKT